MKLNEVSSYKGVVEFEDVDATFVMHHPKYLFYFERARIQAMKEAGLSFSEYCARGYSLAIAEVKLQYFKPLRMDQSFYIHSVMLSMKKSSFIERQVISLEETVSKEVLLNPNLEKGTFITVLEGRFVCLSGKKFVPEPFPQWFLDTFCKV